MPEENDEVKSKRLGPELLNACFFGNVSEATKLIERGADMTYTDPRDGWAAIHYAARFGKRRIVEMMLKAGVDINLKTTGKETALMKAARSNRKETIIWLLKQGANPDILNGSGQMAAELTADNECKYIMNNFDEYMANGQVAKRDDIVESVHTRRKNMSFDEFLQKEWGKAEMKNWSPAAGKGGSPSKSARGGMSPRSAH